MTDDRLPLVEMMAKTGDGDFLRSVAKSVLQIIMEADVDGLIGAGTVSNFVRGAIEMDRKDHRYGDRQGYAGPAAGWS